MVCTTLPRWNGCERSCWVRAEDDDSELPPFRALEEEPLLDPLVDEAGASPPTALLMPDVIVPAKLGCGGGDDDELAPLVAPAPVDAPAPAPDPPDAPAPAPLPDAAPPPADAPAMTEIAVAAMAAPVRAMELTVTPTFPATMLLAILGISSIDAA